MQQGMQTFDSVAGDPIWGWGGGNTGGKVVVR
jgi:hypothetical protein